jgi:hypothetical protein
MSSEHQINQSKRKKLNTKFVWYLKSEKEPTEGSTQNHPIKTKIFSNKVCLVYLKSKKETNIRVGLPDGI